ncbi:MAG: hypothetical protein CSA72_13350 [Rhodobacterales bacterium]|nr:MAG: hypothetical protein CSA72_13350 [Rhodobacterales bacterium]
MRIAYHIGANCTDDDRLLKSLLKNADTLARDGIRVPGPGKYRNLLRKTLRGLEDAPTPEDAREVLLDEIVDGSEIDGLVMSYSQFLCFPKRIFENGLFYELANEKIGGMRRIFPDDQICYFMGMRNPATFIPAVFASQNDWDYAKFMRRLDPRAVLWSDAVIRIRRADPNAELTVWCDEDSPLIWAQLVRLVAGIDPMTRINGGFDLLQSLLTDNGMKRFVAYLRTHPPQTEAHKRRVIAAFMEKYARPDVMEQEIDLPGWDQALVEDLTANYLDDIEKVRRIEGVTFIGA